MTISMYQASVPVLARALQNLSAILDKAVAHADAKKIDHAALTNARLFPDMYHLIKQVQISSDFAKNGAARLAGIEAPKMPDEETTFAQLKERCDKTVAFLKTLKPAQIDGSEDRAIEIPLRTRTLNFRGQAYLLQWVMPNFYFHVTTAYNILRHNGVELGKWDFLGKD